MADFFTYSSLFRFRMNPDAARPCCTGQAKRLLATPLYYFASTRCCRAHPSARQPCDHRATGVNNTIVALAGRAGMAQWIYFIRKGGLARGRYWKEKGRTVELRGRQRTQRTVLMPIHGKRSFPWGASGGFSLAPVAIRLLAHLTRICWRSGVLPGSMARWHETASWANDFEAPLQRHWGDEESPRHNQVTQGVTA